MNKNLHNARTKRNDEFYTQYKDIKQEVDHYSKYLFGKTIYMNCDKPFESEFITYFVNNFSSFGIGKLIATYYNPDGVSEKWEYENSDWTSTKLEGNGDFRSDECVSILQEADVVITNPPFSLFRDFIDLMFQHNKEFLVIGNNNAISYKDIFTLLKENKVWLGYSSNKHFEFKVPKDAENYQRIDDEGNKYDKGTAVSWFTNLGLQETHEELNLEEIYKGNEDKYPKYDNYNAINVDRVKQIPIDYKGYMGVPITFMSKYNPKQFEILGIMNTGEANEGIRLPNTRHGRPLVNGKEKYIRILIKNKKPI